MFFLCFVRLVWVRKSTVSQAGLFCRSVLRESTATLALWHCPAPKSCAKTNCGRSYYSYLGSVGVCVPYHD